jgi:hypothetical protein
MVVNVPFLRALGMATCCCALGIGFTTSTLSQEHDLYAAQLAKYEVEPTTESIAAYLSSLSPSAEHQQELAALVAQLGDESYARREAATRQLLQQPTGLQQVLASAMQRGDAETRWRAKLISEQTARESQTLLHAVLMTIHRRQLARLAPQLLDIAHFCPDEPLRSSLRRALEASQTPADTSRLLAALQASQPEQRALAAATLPLQSPEAADKHLPALLTDGNARVKLAAARALANRGRREPLPVLVELLSSDELPVRVEAIRTLKAVTGQPLPYVVYDSVPRRAEQVTAWKRWVEQEGGSAKLHFPLRDLQVELGRLLICDQQNNQVVEYDSHGKEIWKQKTPAQPWGCQGLENGHRLVCSFAERLVVEYDAQGSEIWRATELPGGPTSVQRLDSGHTLLACTEGSEVVEVDRAGKIVWRAKIDGRPVDARRLDNGRTLVALQNAQKVVELDTDGKVAWEIGGVGNVFCAQRLDSGNTLVCSVGHAPIREFDREGKVVWTQGKFLTPYTAQRLSNGNTMVADRRGIHEMDPTGAIVQHVPTPRISRAHRY